jgi:site-specific recombinase XerC
MVNNNIYENLIVQFEKVFKHNRQLSFKSRQRYKEAFKRFLAFLAAEYRLERLGNIAPKHVFAYAAQLEEKGRSAAFLKIEISQVYLTPLNKDGGKDGC